MTAGLLFFLLSREVEVCSAASILARLTGAASITAPGSGPSESDGSGCLVELHSKMADMESRFTGPEEDDEDDDDEDDTIASFRDPTPPPPPAATPLPGGLVLRRKRVARWNRPSLFFFSSRASGSSLGDALAASRRSVPSATDASMAAQLCRMASRRRRPEVRFRLLVGVCCGVVLAVELAEVPGSSWLSFADVAAPPSPWSSFHRGRSMYT